MQVVASLREHIVAAPALAPHAHGASAQPLYGFMPVACTFPYLDSYFLPSYQGCLSLVVAALVVACCCFRCRCCGTAEAALPAVRRRRFSGLPPGADCCRRSSSCLSPQQQLSSRSSSWLSPQQQLTSRATTLWLHACGFHISIPR
eukprot:COSAG01_NODE_8083_length_2926_cov_25.908030_3_plen_146_part_00